MAKLDQKKTPFFDKIKAYGKSGTTPLDVPGHKLGSIHNEFREYLGTNAFLLDANAPRGLDNLSKPKGVIKEAQALAADAFGADHAYFLLNGTSQGIMAMIMASVRAKEKIIIPRNVHKSAINGLILSGAMPIFMKPYIDTELGIANGIDIDELKETIEEHPDAKAIFVINPTYFGVASNLKEIVKIAHEHNMLVLCDEAHGSHFIFNDKLPMSAMEAGADMAAGSIHKTIGSLTQSSILLTKGNLVEPSRVQSTLNVLQTTSPSSLFMASLDTARSFMATKGSKLLDNLIQMADEARKEINQIDGFKAITKSDIINQKGFDYDETKIMVKVSDIGITGFEAYNLLSMESNIQMELAETHLVLAVLSIGTTKKDLDNFVSGLKKLKDYQKDIKIKHKIRFTYPDSYTRPREAYHAPKKYVRLEDALNEVAAENIMVYPPGIPLVIPGEIINQEILDDLEFYMEQGSTILSDTEDGYIKVVDKDLWYKYEGDL
ncbi:aminotransferase class I/II-fold pyridoxal phosphate-dependent enzyme [Acholeplasma granularum]|uniref:aminotransferase class I/II-fold pyridoxal phosphate-dependent enzyme n=1 Tax=Acholeplasma granularum TaxID=264635 RepID=UPI0004BC3C90|nr:aminotransferase class I/II-fold pyridoxal phosphate-dependent enzyme [Acholeplasma granularum]